MDPLQEYLISLGFRVEQQSWQRFRQATTSARALALGLGAAVVATAGMMVRSVHQIAQGYENLYWAAQRTGTTVLGLQSVGFGMRQIGISAEASRGAVEAFARAMNLQPGLAALAGGRAGQDNVDRMLATVQRLQKMGRPGTYGFAVASQFADLFGIPYDMLTRTPEQIQRAIDARQEYARLAKAAGLDTEAASRKFVAFEQAVSHLGAAINVFSTRMASDWADAARSMIEWADKAVQDMTTAYDMINRRGGGQGAATKPRQIVGPQPRTIGEARRMRGGAAAGPAVPLPDTPATPQVRPKVMPSAKVWGDDEAVAAGLYDPLPGDKTRLGAGTVHKGGDDKSVTVNQNNTISVTAGGNASPREISQQIMTDQERLKASFGDVVRNMQGNTR